MYPADGADSSLAGPPTELLVTEFSVSKVIFLILYMQVDTAVSSRD